MTKNGRHLVTNASIEFFLSLDICVELKFGFWSVIAICIESIFHFDTLLDYLYPSSFTTANSSSYNGFSLT